MWKRVLVTGCAGYVGRSLLPLLREEVEQGGLFGTSRRAQAPESGSLLDSFMSGELSSADDARRIVHASRPKLVIHLASLRKGTMAELLLSNVVATDNLLRAVRAAEGNDTRVVVIGSSAEIGLCREEELPLAENATCQPVDDYGISKLAQSCVARAAYLSHGQSVVRLRLFNLLGPNLPPALLPGRCVELLKSNLTANHRVKLSFGDLSTKRDYIDVSDACRAILLAARFGRSGALYHVGSGKAVAGTEVVAALAAKAGVEVQCESHSSTHANGVVPVQIANAALAKQELSWQSAISFERSIERMWLAESDERVSDKTGRGVDKSATPANL